MPRFRPRVVLAPDDAGLKARRNQQRLGVIGLSPHNWSSAVRDPITSEWFIHKQWYGLMKGDKYPENKEAEQKILAAVRKLLSDEKKWTKGTLCRLGGGKIWHRVDDPGVCSWCIVGALDLIKVKHTALAVYADKVYNQLNARVRQIGFGCLEDFNDDSRVTHAHLIKFLDKMLEASK